ncbi:MAG: hypothetical protein WCJ93_05570 [Methanomicrobiales archaeon]
MQAHLATVYSMTRRFLSSMLHSRAALEKMQEIYIFTVISGCIGYIQKGRATGEREPGPTPGLLVRVDMGRDF